MAMTTGGCRRGVQSDINVTPMIDVLLVLLIIFMITQPLSRMALDVQVPPPDTPVDQQAPAEPDRAGAVQRRRVRHQWPTGTRTSWIPRSTPSTMRGRPSCSSSRRARIGSIRT